jgi:hypothetical protein
MHGDTLRIPTVAVTVELATIGQRDPARGELFVIDDPHTRHHHDALAEAVALLLENQAQFVPFRIDGVVRLVAKSAIVTVTIPGAPRTTEEEGETDFVLYDRQHRVEVLLVQGTRFEGLFLDNSPAEHPRAIDHLNSMARYVRLWSADKQVFIGKAQIATVTELREAE